MSIQSAQESIVNRLNQYLEVSDKRGKDKEIESRSNKLADCIKEPGFLEGAHALLTNPQAFPHERKDKIILLTSLLKDKFKYEFQTVQHNVELHYKQLCQIAHSLQRTSYASYTNISLAMAYTYLSVLSNHPSNLSDFLSPLVPTDESKSYLYNYYFKTLQYVATEIQNSKFVIDEDHRQIAERRLVNEQISILHKLNEMAPDVFARNDINKEHILMCFQAWITVHYDPNVLNSLPSHTLFSKALDHIEDEECGQGASNVLRSIIYQLKDLEQNKIIYESLSHCTLQILQLVQKSLKDLQLDKAQQFMRIIADFSRKSKKMFIERFDQNIAVFLEKLIYYMQDDLLNTYETIADIFEELLDQLVKIKKEGKITINPDIFRIFEPLYSGLCHKCMISSKTVKELNNIEESKAYRISSMAEETFKYREFTESIFETMSDLQGKKTYLEMVLSKMSVLTPEQKNFWSYLEVYLNSLIDAVREYPSIDKSAISILQMYIQLIQKPDGIPICVKRSFLRVLRGFMTSVEKNNQFAYRTMCIAVSCFDNPLLQGVAEKTFCRGCEQNKQMGKQIFVQFGPVLQKYPQRDYIVKGLITLMCINAELANEYLFKALTFLFSKFKEEIDKAKRKDYMHSIVAAIKAFKQSPIASTHKHILQQFTREIWPFAKQVLSSPQRLKDDEDSDVERIVRILKILMRTLQFLFAEFLEDLFSTVLSAFKKHPICSYVYLVEVAVTVYSSNSSFTDYLRKLYSDFCSIAYEHMTKIEDIAKYSYFLDDFMGMNKRFFLYAPNIVLTSGKLPNMIDISIQAFMGCNIPRVAKAAYSFFDTMFLVYWRPEYISLRNSQPDITPFIPKQTDFQNYFELKTFLLQKMELIIGKMLEHLSSAPTEQTRDYILDALVSQIKGFTQQNPSIWGKILSNISSDILLQKEKEKIVQMLESLKTSGFQQSRETVKALDKMLVLINRRMINAEKRRNISF